MTKLKEFLKTLETYRKPPSDDPYDNRVTHCYLAYELKGKTHHFEVRGWAKKIDSEGVLKIAVVNWTLCAGTAMLYMDEDIVDEYKILESIY
jgi:hypothetical protein